MWQTRKLEYYTDEPQEDWHVVTEKFFRRNMGTKQVRNGHTKPELLAFLKSRPGYSFKTPFREFRFV